jgi:hypothetical protein
MLLDPFGLIAIAAFDAVDHGPKLLRRHAKRIGDLAFVRPLSDQVETSRLADRLKAIGSLSMHEWA